MKMLRNKCIIIIVTFSFVLIFQDVKAQNIENKNLLIHTINQKVIDHLFTKTIDWKMYDYYKKKAFYSDGVECGNLNIDLPEWISINNTYLKFHKKLLNKDIDSNGDFVSISIECRTKNINWPNAAYGYVFFNEKNGQWEITDKYKHNLVDGTKYPMFKIYPLQAKNSSGFFVTITNKSHYAGDDNDVLYEKEGVFCLYNNNHTKKFCCGGVVNTTPHIDNHQSDYTQMLIQILQTVRFVDDK